MMEEEGGRHPDQPAASVLRGARCEAGEFLICLRVVRQCGCECGQQSLPVYCQSGPSHRMVVIIYSPSPGVTTAISHHPTTPDTN